MSCVLIQVLYQTLAIYFNLVNSQNNERIFFADAVILVEGLSDRIFIEALLNLRRGGSGAIAIVEVVAVGGKGLFAAYQKLLDACDVHHFTIADLDYVEQRGDATVKSLFVINAQEIKKDVIENAKSMDAQALVSHIQDAIDGASWDDAEHVWEYIKSRRKVLSNDLSDGQRRKLSIFLEKSAAENVYILSRGALESYLPEGHFSKDLDKLIRLVAADNLFDLLPSEPARELQQILDSIMEKVR